jgi:type IV secretory pathway VirB10-like protein
MRETSTPAGTVPVTDHRAVPRGVLPRGLQMWLMVAVAAGMVGIIVFTGHSQPVPRIATTATTLPPGMNPDRLRDYQDRLRALDERARLQAVTDVTASRGAPVAAPDQGQRASRPTDSLIAERKRREYDSLFAGNVVLSRRATGQQPLSDRDAGTRSAPPTAARDTAPPTRPNLDEVADAVVRATSRYGPASLSGLPPSAAAVSAAPSTSMAAASSTGASRSPVTTDSISAAGPVHRLLEGTLIDTVLTNRLDGATAAPVNCLVTNPIYSHSGQDVLIPAGSRVLGETKPVQTVGESRLAVAFHRLLLPDGRTVSLDQFVGLNQLGDAALRDQVNHHYWSTFGAASAVGLVSGLGQYLGTAGLGQGSGNRTLVIAGGSGNATAEATAQVMNRFLNRLPTITIREGHRVKVYLTGDLDLPAYEARTLVPPSTTARVP